MRYANLLSSLCVGFLLGVFWYSFIIQPPIGVVFLIAVGVCLVAIVFHRRVELCHILTALCFCFVGMGVAGSAFSQILDADYSFDRKEVEMEGVVVDMPDYRADGRVFLKVEPTSLYKDISHSVRVRTERGEYEVGDVLSLKGVVERPRDFEGFAYRGWLARHNIGFVMNNPEIERVGYAGAGYQGFLSGVRNKMGEGLDTMLPPSASSLYRAMLLGDRGGLDDSFYTSLQKAGLAHIVAISGLHIAVIFLGLFFLFSLFRLRRQYVGVLTMVALVLFALMVGGSASVIRAVCLAGVVVLAEMVGRPYSPLRLLLVVAAVMVAMNPLILRYDIGFQLSFVAVLGILVSYSWHRRVLPFVPRRFNLRSLVGVSLFVSLAVAPLTVYHFGYFSGWSVITNLLVVSMLPVVLVVGAVTAVFGMLNAPKYLAVWASVLADYVSGVANVFSGATFLDRFYNAYLAGVVFFGVAFIGFIFVPQSSGVLSVYFLDIGQGDGVFIRTPEGRAILIDGGDAKSSTATQVGSLVPFYDQKIDVVIATHFDSDHIGGLYRVIEHFDVGVLVMPRYGLGGGEGAEFLQYVERYGVEVVMADTIRHIRIGDVVLRNITPQMVAENSNQSSLVWRMDYHNDSFLFTGDIEFENEEVLVDTVPDDVKADVLKVAHHGSRSSSSLLFLDAVRPSIAVIQVGKGNPYKHPHSFVLDRLRERHILVLRNDIHGRVVFHSTGNSFP